MRGNKIRIEYAEAYSHSSSQRRKSLVSVLQVGLCLVANDASQNFQRDVYHNLAKDACGASRIYSYLLN